MVKGILKIKGTTLTPGGFMLETIAEISTSMISLFNIPFIMNIRKRKCSCDISLTWAAGIWVCSVLMLVASVFSGSTIFRVIAVTNLIIFTITTLYILRYHHIKGFEKIPEFVGKALYTAGKSSVADTNKKESYFYFVE